MKQFDLNIDKILENWECRHAVREIIANALDEQKITKTQEIEIYKDGLEWVIRDYGRGLRYEHLVQSENFEKLNTNGVIGKFGIGLKDALATFERHGVRIKIYSKYTDISIRRLGKHGFEDLMTLHATIGEPSRHIVGTEFRISNILDQEILSAKRMFLKFSDEKVLETTKYGEVIEKNGDVGNIYINGVLVAKEPNFLFSYNITNIDSILKKSLNRERTNVGRSAYATIVRRILLNCNSEIVGTKLSSDLSYYSLGKNHDELRWIDVQEHAANILAKCKAVVFVTSSEIQNHTDLVQEASDNNREVIVIPDNLSKKIEESNIEQKSENRVTTFTQFVQQRSDNFEYKFVTPSDLSDCERENYGLIDLVLKLIGGRPCQVKSIEISETMQKDPTTFYSCTGLWMKESGKIIILRSILKNRTEFLGTFIHELAHAISGCSDATRGFERELTRLLGIMTDYALKS